MFSAQRAGPKVSREARLPAAGDRVHLIDADTVTVAVREAGPALDLAGHLLERVGVKELALLQAAPAVAALGLERIGVDREQ